MIAIMHFSQVGINTTLPEKSLDVNGVLSLRKELRIGGTSSQKGNPGTTGQFFKVIGNNTVVNDSWETVKIADGTGSLSLFYLNTVSDVTGISSDRGGDTGVYLLNANTDNANFITGLVDNFTVTKTDNKSKAILSFQTVAQIARSSGAGSASFACGVFLKKDSDEEKLKAVRNDAVRGVSGTFKTYNLNVTLDNLEIGVYQVRVACYYRNLSNGTTLGIGRPVDTNTLNADMSKSTLTTSVLQTY